MAYVWEDPVDAAAREGLDLVLPEADQLFIDLDEPGNRELLQHHLKVLERNGFHFRIERETLSKGGRGRKHVYIRTDLPIAPAERIALQACLGTASLRLWTGRLVINFQSILSRPRGVDPS